MKYNELKAQTPKIKKRLGRGIAAGQGKTAGRGTKGQKSRTGASRNPGFSGGQNPIMQALPKLPGFKSKRQKPVLVYTSDLNLFKGSTVNATSLKNEGFIENEYTLIKLVVRRGDLTKKLNIELPMASKSSIEQIKKAGGTFKTVDRLQHPPKLKK